MVTEDARMQILQQLLADYNFSKQKMEDFVEAIFFITNRNARIVTFLIKYRLCLLLC